jgi:hypothetical protein
MSKKVKLTLVLTDENGDRVLMDHVEVYDPVADFTYDQSEVRSNPAMGAVLAGAPPEVCAGLPGEQVAMLHSGTEMVLTYKVRIRMPGSGLGEFRPALPR